MRIAIDARAAAHTQPGGFKSYAEGLIEGLARLDTRDDFFLYYDRIVDSGNLALNFHIKNVSSWPKPLGSVLREQLTLPLQMARERVEVSHFLSNTAPLRSPGRRVVTVHDVLLLLDGTARLAASASVYHGWMNSYLRLFQRAGFQIVRGWTRTPTNLLTHTLLYRTWLRPFFLNGRDRWQLDFEHSLLFQLLSLPVAALEDLLGVGENIYLRCRKPA